MALPGSKTSRCYVCGPDNPLGLRVPFTPDGEMGSMGTYTVRAEHCGWNGILHGGVTFALMDEAFGWSLYFRDIPAVTARAETRFIKPIPAGTRLIVKAWVVNQRRRLFDAHAEVRVDGPENTLLAECDATMCVIDKVPDGDAEKKAEQLGATV